MEEATDHVEMALENQLNAGQRDLIFEKENVPRASISPVVSLSLYQAPSGLPVLSPLSSVAEPPLQVPCLTPTHTSKICSL